MQALISKSMVKRRTVSDNPSTVARIRKAWSQDVIEIILPYKLTTCPLPDLPDTVAFMEGPKVLAGILGDGSPNISLKTNENGFPREIVESLHEKTLYGNLSDPTSILIPDNERTPSHWRSGYRTIDQLDNIRLIPLYEVRDQNYAVYFPIKGRS